MSKTPQKRRKQNTSPGSILSSTVGGFWQFMQDIPRFFEKVLNAVKQDRRLAVLWGFGVLLLLVLLATLVLSSLTSTMQLAVIVLIVITLIVLFVYTVPRLTDIDNPRAEFMALTIDALNSLHELDNAIRLVVGPLTRFGGPDWSDAKRDETINQIDKLAEQEVILTRVRQSISRLADARKSAKSDWKGVKAADLILECGWKTLNALGYSAVTPWPGPYELALLMSDLRAEKSPEVVQRVKEQAEKVNSIVDRKLLRDADLAL